MKKLKQSQYYGIGLLVPILSLIHISESISDHEISLNKMQTDLSNFIHTIRGEMLTIYSEQDLIAAMREAVNAAVNILKEGKRIYKKCA